MMSGRASYFAEKNWAEIELENNMEIFFWNVAVQMNIRNDKCKELIQADIIHLTETWKEKLEVRTLENKLKKSDRG